MEQKREVKTLLLATGVAGLVVAISGGFAAASFATEDVASPSSSHHEDGFAGVSSDVLENLDPQSPAYEVVSRAAHGNAITASDYEQAHAEYEQCVSNGGFQPSFRKTADGLYIELPYIGVDDVDALEEVRSGRAVPTAPVTELYRVQIANPEALRDPRAVAIECLANANYVNEGYTVGQFERDWANDTLPFDAVEVEANDCLYGAGYGYFDFDRQ